MASFLVLFVLPFAILQAITGLLIAKKIDFGFLPERIGRVVCGMLLGLIISGVLLTGLSMGPLPRQYPYGRFDSDNPDIDRPNKTLLNPDGFVTGWFNLISSGSLKAKSSFSVLHADFINSNYLNRQSISEGVSILTDSQTIKLPRKDAAWLIDRDLKDTSGKTIPQKSGQNLTIVRLGLTSKAVIADGTFTLSQLRFICNKQDKKEPLTGKGNTIYPIGYITKANQLKLKALVDKIKISTDDLIDGVRWIDLVFYVPEDFKPVLIEFKQNALAEIPATAIAKKAPASLPFVPASECSTNIAQLQPVDSSALYGLELAAGNDLLAGLTLEIRDINHLKKAQTNKSIKPLTPADTEIKYIRSELRIAKPAKKTEEENMYEEPTKIAVNSLLSVPEGYSLVSLSCNSPALGQTIKSQQLPTLTDLSGTVHHPVGVIASGQVGKQIIYELDYCSVVDGDTNDCLVIGPDNAVTQPFPESIWLTETAEDISQFYVLYLVPANKRIIITSVKPGDSKTAAQFKEYEGFLVK
jgi:hypothetical protein